VGGLHKSTSAEDDSDWVCGTQGPRHVVDLMCSREVVEAERMNERTNGTSAWFIDSSRRRDALVVEGIRVR
jgi:hypothetical protein